MKKLTLLDQGFLEMESDSNPLHVGIVQVFKGELTAEKYNRLLRYYTGQLKGRSPFNQKLSGPVMGRFDWIDSGRLNLDYHLQRHTLPGAGLDAVIKKTSVLHSPKMSRDYPLWQLFSFEGLKDGLFALYFKIHHACLDGVAGIRLAQSFLSTDKEEVVSTRPAHTEPKHEGGIHLLDPFSFFNRAARLVREEYDAVKEMASSFIADWQQNKHMEDHLLPLPFTSPETCFNGPGSPRRNLEVRSFPVDKLRTTKRKYKVTLNDLVLAMCSGALRRYLLYRGELPRMPLSSFVPVSIRPRHGKEQANELAFILVNLGTHLEKAEDRLKIIHASANKGKEQLAGMSRAAIRRHSEMFFALGSLGTGALQHLPPMFNLVISNVPGSRKPLYLDGMPLESVYPVSVLFPTQALNITIIGYANRMDIGLLGCADTIPDLDRLAQYLDESYLELVDLAEPRK